MYFKLMSKLILIIGLLTALTNAQFDLGEVRRGENRGNLTPGQIATITFIVIAISIALGVTAFFCYYVNNQSRKTQARYAYQEQRSFT